MAKLSVGIKNNKHLTKKSYDFSDQVLRALFYELWVRPNHKYDYMSE